MMVVVLSLTSLAQYNGEYACLAPEHIHAYDVATKGCMVPIVRMLLGTEWTTKHIT